MYRQIPPPRESEELSPGPVASMAFAIGTHQLVLNEWISISAAGVQSALPTWARREHV